MSRARCVVATVALLCLAWAAWGQHSSPVVAVVGVGEERQSPELRSLQEGLVHLVQSELARQSAGQVVGRQQTALFLEELGMGAAQLTEPKTRQRFGAALSADYLVFVRLSGEGGVRATVTVTQVSSGQETWGAGFRGEHLLSLAEEISDALVEVLHLPPAEVTAAEGGPSPTVAVLDFRRGGAAGALDRHLTDLGDLLSANLSALKVPLVERGKLGAVLEELGLSASGLVRSTDMAKVGRLLGAQRMVDTAMIMSGQRVLLDSQVIEPATGLVVGSCRVSSDGQQLPSAVQELALDLAEVLRVPATEAGKSALSQQATSSLEAALHAAVGWRLGEAGRAQEAVKEYQQAVFLDPGVAWWWYQLGQQYRAMGDDEKWAEALKRFFPAADGRAEAATLAEVALYLAEAEASRHRPEAVEAAARLSLQYEDTADGREMLVRALCEQGKLAEARRYSEALARRADIDHDSLVSIWCTLLGRIVTLQPDLEQASEGLECVASALELFEDGDQEADIYLGAQMHNAILACCNMGRPDWLRLDNQVRYAEEGIRLATWMTTFEQSGRIASRGRFLRGLLSYKLGRAEDALDAFSRCLHDYPTAVYDADADGAIGPSQAKVYYLLGRVYEDLLHDRERAVAAFQQMLYSNASGAEGDDARIRLAALGGVELPPAPWLRCIGGAGQPIEGDFHEQLAAWLHGHEYDLRLQVRPPEVQLAGAAINLLAWRSRKQDYPSAEQLRSYVAGGGNLLILLGARQYSDYFESHGPLLGISSATMDASLDWLLPAFGMTMSRRAISVDWLPLDRGPSLSSITLDSPSYSGTAFPLEAPDAAMVLGLPQEGTSSSRIVAANATLGLGNVVVISLRTWFVGGDLFRIPPEWQYQLFQGFLDWFGQETLPRRYPQAAQHWAASRRLVAIGEYGAAVQELDEVDSATPSAADARYWAGCLLADRLGDIEGAVQRWRRVIASSDADSWLVRMAHLRIGIAAVRARDERTATAELTQVAGDQPDGIWGQAWVAGGDLKLAQRDYLSAAQAFRKVADELGHCEERFRALFGLAYALDRQGKPEAADRIYDAIVVEFGQAPLPSDMDVRWPDPWEIYYPASVRSDEPTVADAVAAARPRL